jgi:hypothetical protein
MTLGAGSGAESAGQIQPVFPNEHPSPQRPRSRRTTSAPARASECAHASPTAPPPTTATLIAPSSRTAKPVRHNGGVEEWERRKILGEWGVRGENARERRERLVLERDLAGGAHKGRRVRLRPQPLGPSPESYVASLGGPLPYMVRLKEIEEETEGHAHALERVWRQLSEECGGDGAAFARRWRRFARRWNFTAVNELIERHNRYYPTEARLPMDPRTRDFALVNGQPYWKRRLGEDWVLERFPPVLAAAAAAGTWS